MPEDIEKRVTPAIKKVYNLSDNTEAIRCYKEANIPEFLSTLSLNCSFPETTFVKKKGEGIIYMDEIPGWSLKKIFSNSEVTGLALEKVINALAEIHLLGAKNKEKLETQPYNLKLERFDLKKDFYERFVVRVNSSVKTDIMENYGELSKLIEKLPLDFAHMDPHAENWIINLDNRLQITDLTLIDWEKTALTSGMYDLAYVLEDPDLDLSENSKKHYIIQYILKKEELSGTEFSQEEKNLQYTAYCFAAIHASLAYVGKIYEKSKSKSLEREECQSLRNHLLGVENGLSKLNNAGLLTGFKRSLDDYIEKTGLNRFYTARAANEQDIFDILFSDDPLRMMDKFFRKGL